MGKTELVYVPVKFSPEVTAALDDLARSDRAFWYDHGGAIGEQPSRSAAVRQLVTEGLAGRNIHPTRSPNEGAV